MTEESHDKRIVKYDLVNCVKTLHNLMIEYTKNSI